MYCLSKAGTKRCAGLFYQYIAKFVNNRSIKLYNSIKNEGMRNPLDAWRDKDRVVIHRGGRRLEILKLLGYKNAVYPSFS